MEIVSGLKELRAADLADNETSLKLSSGTDAAESASIASAFATSGNMTSSSASSGAGMSGIGASVAANAALESSKVASSAVTSAATSAVSSAAVQTVPVANAEIAIEGAEHAVASVPSEDALAFEKELFSGAIEDVAVELPLIEFAEVLDQHKLWVESGGESGRRADLSGINLTNADLTGVNLHGAILDKAKLQGADLSMANLRGASLVQADLRDATLLGTELHGANLMGATVYGAEGMWVGRLGGANLFDALLPETQLATFDSTHAIQQATRVARLFYFMTLAICAVCVLLIGFTTDLRLL